MKEIRLFSEYGVDSPLWRGKGWDNETGPISLESLNISEMLKKELLDFSRWKKFTWDIVESELGGNWTGYTRDQFETARIKLGIPVFPTHEEDEKTKKILIQKLKNELEGYEFKICDN